MMRKPNISFTLLLAAFMVGALSFVMPKNKEKYLGDMFWSRKTFAPAKYDVVIMGDSRIYRGVSPDIVEKHIPGKNVFNFGYSNGGLNPFMFKAAESKLNKNRKTKIIVLGITANTITGYTKNNDQYIQELNRPREEVLERLYFNPVLYWFSATSPDELKDNFKDGKDTSYYLSEYHMNGYVESEKYPADTMEALPSYTKDFSSFKVEKESLDALFGQVKRWKEKGISVVAFRPPVSYSMRALEDTMGLYNESFIKTGIEQAGGHWIDIDFTKFKTYDGSHLDKPSAVKLSEEIGKQLDIFLKSH
ncbi:MAG: hypothetical protein JW798_03065 [Prolixibacteraceae bacterium]|nr:hypothetical protein [Prolixibacteraceae bacterium]